MGNDPDELMLPLLREIRAGQDDAKTDRQEIKDSILSLREDVHGLRGDVLRIEKGLASVELDVDRIKTRLDLVDEQPNG